MPNESPLRLLVITSRPLLDPNGNPIVLLDVEEERRRIRAALNLTPSGSALTPDPSPTRRGEIAVRAHFLPNATVGAITDALAHSWDVVHVTGHGSPDGRLWFEDEFGVGQLVDARDVVQLFGSSLPRVVVLSLCYSGRALPDALLEAGVRAVVAIQADQPIADRAATLFNQQFYSLLARGSTVQEAFDRAQTRVRLDPQVGDPPSPPTPSPTGRGEKPWSQRFVLIGNGAGTLPATTGDYHETGAGERVRGNLRGRNRNFVGRAKEIVEIVKAFDARGVDRNARRVAVWGSGGLGKTELAKAVAWWYVERGRVDAVLWASASPAEGEYILRDLASLLSIAARAFSPLLVGEGSGVRSDSPRLVGEGSHDGTQMPEQSASGHAKGVRGFSEQMPFDQQKAVVRDFFAQQRAALLILDNWETLVNTKTAREVWDFVLNLPDTVRVLVTSRDILPARDARNIELDTLTPDDAAQLFITIAHNAGYFDRNPQLSREQNAILGAIIERLGGYPLAVEVVAGQTESRSLDDIWSDLVRIPKNVLEGKDELTGEPRGVWTSLGFSYDVLPDAEKEMFRKMGVFLAPATVEDIAAIVGLSLRAPSAKQSPSDAEIASSPSTLLAKTRETLDTLVRRSLVRFREGHYALLPIVRDYAESHLVEAGQAPQDLHVRAANYYGAKGTIESALTASDHMYELAVRFGSREVAQAFIKYVAQFYPDLVVHGRWAEAHYKIKQMTAVADVLEDINIKARSLAETGNLYLRIGEYESAEVMYRQSQMLLKRSGDTKTTAEVSHGLGVLSELRGNYDEAEQQYGESLNQKRGLGDERGVLDTLLMQGRLARQKGNSDTAEHLLNDSLKLAERLKDELGIAQVQHELGVLATEQKKYVKAVELYRASLGIFTKRERKSERAAILHDWGVTEFLQGNYDKAGQLYDQSFQLKELDDKHGISILLFSRGRLAQAQDKYADAERLYDESMRLAEQLGDRSGIASTLGQMGKLAQVDGEFKEAFAYFLNALVLFLELQSPYRYTVLQWMRELRQQVGDEQFQAWLGELVQDEGSRKVLVEMLDGLESASTNEKRINE